MTRSSGISSGAADSVVVESSHSFQAAFYPCFQRLVPCHRAWLEELLLLMVARDREAGGSEVSREKGGKHFVLARGCCKEEAMEGP